MAFVEGLSMEGTILAVILGTLAGIVYSLRILVLVERRIQRIDSNIERLTKRMLKEELKIEATERRIQKALKKPNKRKKRS